LLLAEAERYASEQDAQRIRVSSHATEQLNLAGPARLATMVPVGGIDKRAKLWDVRRNGRSEYHSEAFLRYLLISRGAISARSAAADR
jgi:hypothetical protein